ncbi:MAG: patatin-like phospholipase family protein [Candidatus Marinimicrobia bacterium]|nr:patatin-like phospholipase family protein [Candidatus Neomarinimicrobiota bacterium]
MALGGGGVRGLAHGPALEAIDAAGLKPVAIAGTSMGAIMGALYASGKTGKEIRQLTERHIVSRDDGLKDVYAKKDTLLTWLRTVRIAWDRSGLLKADGFVRYLTEQMAATCFEDLKIPLRVVATDFYSGEPFVFDSGPLLPALKASMAIPGVFVPVEYAGRILVDGGLSNNLPYDVLPDECRLDIAVDVRPLRERQNPDPPHMVTAILGMFDIMLDRMTRAKLREQPPALLFHPPIAGVHILEFDKAASVLKQTAAALPDFKAQLDQK